MLRDNLVGLIEPMRISAGVDPLALSIQKQASDDRSSCLENPRPEGAESSLTETSPLHFRLSQHNSIIGSGLQVARVFKIEASRDFYARPFGPSSIPPTRCVGSRGILREMKSLVNVRDCGCQANEEDRERSCGTAVRSSHPEPGVPNSRILLSAPAHRAHLHLQAKRKRHVLPARSSSH